MIRGTGPICLRVKRVARLALVGSFGAAVVVLGAPEVRAQTSSSASTTSAPAATTTTLSPTSSLPAGGVGPSAVSTTSTPLTNALAIAFFSVEGGRLDEFSTGTAFSLRVVVTNTTALPFTNVPLVVRFPDPATISGGTINGTRVGLVADAINVWYHTIGIVPPNSASTYVVSGFMPCSGKWALAARVSERTVVEIVQFNGGSSPRCDAPTTTLDLAADLHWPPTPLVSSTTTAPSATLAAPALTPPSTRSVTSPTTTNAAPPTAVVSIASAGPGTVRSRVVLQCRTKNGVRVCTTIAKPVATTRPTTIPRTLPPTVLSGPATVPTATSIAVPTPVTTATTVPGGSGAGGSGAGGSGAGGSGATSTTTSPPVTGVPRSAAQVVTPPATTR